MKEESVFLVNVLSGAQGQRALRSLITRANLRQVTPCRKGETSHLFSIAESQATSAERFSVQLQVAFVNAKVLAFLLITYDYF